MRSITLPETSISRNSVQDCQLHWKIGSAAPTFVFHGQDRKGSRVAAAIFI